MGHRLEETVQKQVRHPNFEKARAVYIRDGMAVVQAMNGNSYSSFGSLAKSYMGYLIDGFNYAHTICDVFDISNSVKNQERERRAAGFGYKEYEVLAGRSVPQWKQFLCVARNKEKLIRFLGGYITQNAMQLLCHNPDHKIYIAGASSNPEDVNLLCAEYQGNVDELQ